MFSKYRNNNDLANETVWSYNNNGTLFIITFKANNKQVNIQICQILKFFAKKHGGNRFLHFYSL